MYRLSYEKIIVLNTFFDSSEEKWKVGLVVKLKIILTTFLENERRRMKGKG